MHDARKRDPRQVATDVSRWTLACLILPCLFLLGCRPAPTPEVVVYTSQDQVYSEAILHHFTEQTGIRALVVHDSEAVKTVGLANRLLAERSHPRCDIFWSNEELRTRQLAARDLFEDNGWTAFGYRSRRLVINTNLLAQDQAPRNWSDLTNSLWRGRVALAYPMFGTTATHFHALRQIWGPTRWETWCQALVANKPFVVDGNSVVVQLVGKGRAAIGMTDSDDIAAGQREGYPIVALPLGEDSLLIPNTIARVRNGPHPEAALKLFNFLRQPSVVERLIQANALEGHAHTPPSPAHTTLAPDWDTLLRDLDPTSQHLESWFLR